MRLIMLPIISHYLSEYEKISHYYPGYSSGALSHQRKQALDQLVNLGLPGTKDQDWRYVAKSQVIKLPFQLPPTTTSTLTHLQLPEPLSQQAIRLVFINGYWIKPLSIASLPLGLTVTSLATTSEESLDQISKTWLSPLTQVPNGFTAQNSAFAQDGAIIEIASHQVINEPIELLFLTHLPTQVPPALIPIRNLIKVNTHSQVTLIERYHTSPETIASNEASLTNAVTSVALAPHAQVNWYQLAQNDSKHYHIGHLEVTQADQSHLTVHTLSTGGLLTRQALHIALQGALATCHSKGLSLAAQKQHIEHQITVLHQAAQTTSEAYHRAIGTDQSRSIFGGKIRIYPNAFQIKAHQSSHNLLLSEEATIDTQPQLAIFSEDVACTHGATVGQLHEDALLYLQTRGISRTQARKMLIDAFIQIIFTKMPLFTSHSFNIQHLLTEMLDETCAL